MRRTLIVVAGVSLFAVCVSTAPAAAKTIGCPRSRLSDGTPASHESATDVTCSTVHRLLGRAWIWRFGQVEWGGTPGTVPGRTSPKGWRCKETLEYFSTGNLVEQDDDTLVGSTTLCTSARKAFQFTQGRVTRWSHPI